MTYKASDRKFGIEIECYFPVATEVAVGQYHNGLSINWAPSAGWNGQADGSLRAMCPSGYKAVEVVSPVLAGESGLVEIVYMVETIRELGGIVNEACGLHVHVAAGDLDGQKVDKIRQSFMRYEKVFYGLSGTAARNRYYHNSYCRPTSIVRDMSNRYQGCNVVNYLTKPTDRKTVEFRCWAGTLDVETIISAVYMAVALVCQVARSGLFFNGSTVDTFCKVWNNSDNRIVPDEDASQLTSQLVANVSLAGL